MPSAVILLALILAVCCGAALVATSVVDSRRKQMLARIDRTISPFGDSGDLIAPHLALDAAQQKALHPAFAFLPYKIRRQIERVPELTGGRLGVSYVLALAGIAAVGAGFLVQGVLELGYIPAVLVALVVGMITPLAFMKRLKGRYDQQFLLSFPAALDLIVRALKAGLPVSEALSTVASEVSDPVGAEFRRALDEMRIAGDIDVLRATAERIDILDFRFFVSSLVLQRQTGGNLTEIVSNLSTTIRRRNELRLKTRAMSSEGRTSAWVLSVLPVGIGGILYVINPGYMSILLNDPRGHHILGAAVVSLLIGTLSMRQMMKWALR